MFLSEPPIEIQIIAPPGLFKEPFDETTETVDVMHGIRVLKPALILSAKCRAILGRAGEDEKTTDAYDIKFLLRWCAENDTHPSWTLEVPKASKKCVSSFVSLYGGEHLWHSLGYQHESAAPSP